jgi:hypothetical protein
MVYLGRHPRELGAVHKERLSRRRGSKSLWFVWEKRRRRKTNDVRQRKGVGPLHTNVGRRPLWNIVKTQTIFGFFHVYKIFDLCPGSGLEELLD